MTTERCILDKKNIFRCIDQNVYVLFLFNTVQMLNNSCYSCLEKRRLYSADETLVIYASLKM